MTTPRVPFQRLDCDIRTLPSIAAVPTSAWNRLAPGDPDWTGYCRAIEEAPPPGFRLGALTALRGKTVLAAAPLFELDYRLDTSVQGRLRRVTERVRARWPKLLNVRLLAMGSPLLDSCILGLEPDLDQGSLGKLLRNLHDEARRRGCVLTVIKSLSDTQASILHPYLIARRYSRIACLPTVLLRLPFQTLDQYLDSLPAGNGSYLRRKMRSLAEVNIEYCSSVKGFKTQIHALFENTRIQSKTHYNEFEQLHPDYFDKLLAFMGGGVKFMLCSHKGELLSFQTFLVGRHRIFARDIGMKYPKARVYNLYFINFLKMIEFAIQHDIGAIDMGATAYTTKLIFGGVIERRWLYVRFTNPAANAVLRPLVPLFDFEKNDPELRQLNSMPTGGPGPSP